MRDAAPQTVYLADYTPYPWTVQTVALHFTLSPNATRVRSRLQMAPNPAYDGPRVPMFLHGEAVNLLSARIDGVQVQPDVTETGLTCDVPDAPFIWEAEVEIDPAGNTALEGLYLSGGMYCTQCEAEGFRKITYYPDRPDVMSVFTVTIDADAPVKLSNGNDLGDGKWHDPHPKPAYLFALVAGDLVNRADSFTTRSGREVALNIWVRSGDFDKTEFAIDALKASMKWDEDVYGREYDLDLFNIVAVDDFNMGAMENKGLNIFNSSAVLASPATSTDMNFERIEAIIAHEYFHNWTGNRITCRDWFQLCLKEGLTVFRDQQFSEDMRSAEVLRIREVANLRARQFREDAGPLAHPVRPEEYIEINNFYTATVYEKGAEVVRMLHTLVGADTYRKALDLYFERHDGQACTIEDFAAVFEAASGRDLTRFRRWWSQAGTPRVRVRLSHDGSETTLTITQNTPATPGQADKQPLHIPFAVGFLSPEGEPLTLTGPDGEARETHILELAGPSESFVFSGAADTPIPSLLRGFSAPVILDYPHTDAEKALLLAHDSDAFNRAEASRDLALGAAQDHATGKTTIIDPILPNALATALARGGDPAFLALLLSTPGQEEIAASLAALGETVDPDAVYAAKTALDTAIATTAKDHLIAAYEANATPGPYSPDAASAGKRALKNTALAILTNLDDGPAPALAEAQFASAKNMTDSASALATLVRIGGPAADAALDTFHARWKHDPLVIDKWLTLQVAMPRADSLERAKTLRARDDIDWRNPNRFRSLVGAFASNHWRFHATDGSGYDFFAEQIAWLDGVNPQTAARMATAFETWRRYDEARQDKMRAAMRRILDREACSRDTFEIVSRLLG